MNAMNNAKTNGKPVAAKRRMLALSTLLLSVAGFVNKARKARGSTDILDHADVIAGFVSLAVVIARTSRPERRDNRD